MSEHVKSFIVKHGNEKVQIAHKSPEKLIERCKHNFRIDDKTTLTFKLPDSEISVDIESIEILPNKSELHLTVICNIESDLSDTEEGQVKEYSRKKQDLNDTETFEVGGRERKQDKNKFLDLIYWSDAQQSILVLGGILALLYYVSINNEMTVIFHITLLLSLLTICTRAFVSILKIKRMDTLNLQRSTLLYGKRLRYTIVGNIDLGMKSAWGTLHQTIFSDDIKGIVVFQLCFGLFLTAYVLTFFRLTTLMAIVTMAVFIIPKTYKRHESRFERVASIFKRLSRKLRTQPDELHEE